MIPERKQQAARHLFKKLVQAKAKPEAIAELVAGSLHRGSREEPLEELVQWFLCLRELLAHGGTAASRLRLSDLMEGFGLVARKEGLSAERLYATLLERVLVESESDEQARLGSKLSMKEKILNAALDVFSEKGFHPATVDEIADRAGVGKGTLYRYFANKETLFNELVRVRLEELEESAEAVLDGQDDVLTMIGKYLHTYFEFFDRNQQLYRLVAQDRLDVGKQVQDLYVRKVMRRIPVLKRKIHEASQQGVLKDIDFQTVFYGVMGFIHGVMQKWLANDCSYPLVEELPTVMEVLFYGFVKGSRKRSEFTQSRQEEEDGRKHDEKQGD